MSNGRKPSFFQAGEKEDVKRNVRKKAETMATRSTAVCLFCLSETNLLLVSGTEGSPLTNWGCFWEIQTQVCNTHGQLLGVYAGDFSFSLSLSPSVSGRNEFQSPFLRFFSPLSRIPLSSSGPRKTWSTFPGSPALTFSWTTPGKSTILLDFRKPRMVIYFGRHRTSNVMWRSIHGRIYCR